MDLTQKKPLKASVKDFLDLREVSKTERKAIKIVKAI